MRKLSFVFKQKRLELQKITVAGVYIGKEQLCCCSARPVTLIPGKFQKQTWWRFERKMREACSFLLILPCVGLWSFFATTLWFIIVNHACRDRISYIIQRRINYHARTSEIRQNSRFAWNLYSKLYQINKNCMQTSYALLFHNSKKILVKQKGLACDNELIGRI